MTAGSLEFAFTKYSLAVGITHLTWYSSDRIYQHALSFWDTRPLGLPAYYEEDGRTCIPVISTMNEKGLERIRRKNRSNSRLRSIRKFLTRLRTMRGFTPSNMETANRFTPLPPP